MAGNSPEVRTIEQQADDIVAKLQKQEPVTQPISPEVKALAEKKIDALQEADKATIRAALSALKTDAESNVDNSKALIELKKQLESAARTPVSVESLSKLLDNLSEQKDADSRRVIVSYIWSKLNNAGYSMTIQQGKFSLTNPENQKDAELLEKTLESYLYAQKMNIAELQRAILMGSGSFGAYLDTQKVDIAHVSTDKYAEFLAESYKINLSKWNLQQQIQLINRSSMSPEEKAFLISYVNGGFIGYNLAPDAKRQLELKAMNKELVASPEYVKIQGTVDKVSGGVAAQERAAQQAGGKKEELTVESFMDNPVRAISKYPWTSLALVGASIWKYGFGKTIFGLLAGMIGIKAINELAGTEEWKKLKDNLVKWAKDVLDDLTGKGKKAANAGTTTPPAQPAVGPASSIDTSKFSPEQKKVYEKLAANTQLIQSINNLSEENKRNNKAETGDFNAYMSYIFSDKIQNLSLDKMIYTSDPKTSVFSNDGMVDLVLWVPNNIDNNVFKSLMREYLIGKSSLELVSGKSQWQKEREEFERNYPSATYATKTLHDITKLIHK